MAFVVGLLLQPPPAQAQGKLTKITKITCTTVSGSTVIMEDSAAGAVNAITVKKGVYAFQMSKYTAGLAIIYEPISKSTVWQGKINTVRVVGVATAGADSLKVLYLRNYFAN